MQKICLFRSKSLSIWHRSSVDIEWIENISVTIGQSSHNGIILVLDEIEEYSFSAQSTRIVLKHALLRISIVSCILSVVCEDIIGIDILVINCFSKTMIHVFLFMRMRRWNINSQILSRHAYISCVS
jgi:hypothetical protein